MTFCRRVKLDIIQKAYIDCCNASHLYGILSFAKSFSGEEIVINALDAEVIQHFRNCFFDFGIPLNEFNSVCVKKDKKLFLAVTDAQIADRALSDFGYSGDEPNYRILESNLRCESCKAAFISGCFLTGGSITEPQKGYHLEFSAHRYAFFDDFVLMLRSAGFAPKVTVRKSLTRTVYFKDSSQIEDFLIYAGAQDAAMEIMNEKILKDVTNRVNRQTNCESANIDKIVRASEGDRRMINRIFLLAGEERLPEDLREVARLRLQNPELSFSDIGKLTNPELTKSGISHRMRRIRLIANNLQEQKNAE